MQQVKAVFYVEEVGIKGNGQGHLIARPAAKGPYAEWSKYTPSGVLDILTLNEEATEFFRSVCGSDVVVTIRPATEEDIITKPAQ